MIEKARVLRLAAVTLATLVVAVGIVTQKKISARPIITVAKKYSWKKRIGMNRRAETMAPLHGEWR